jgi:hypothetical protein
MTGTVSHLGRARGRQGARWGTSLPAAWSPIEARGSDLDTTVLAGRPDAGGPMPWHVRVARLLADETHTAVRQGELTAAEAEQLLARLVVVIDQAVTPVPW